jgi:transcriptional regulator with XRE-family HTH domain
MAKRRYATRIARALQRAGLTQREAAKQINARRRRNKTPGRVAHTTIGNWARGESSPTLDYAADLAAIAGTEVAELVG